MKLVVRPDGSVLTVYHDSLLALGLGPISTQRASHVEFDASRQTWVASRVGGGTLAEGSNRSEVVEQEVKILEAEL